MVEFSHKKQLANDKNTPEVVNDMQDSIGVIVTQLNNLPLSKSVLVENVTISTTPTLVAHNLGYVARGFIVVDKTSNNDVYRVATPTFDDKRFFYLRTNTGSATISLIVF